jgi:hypothetical protein
MTDKLPVEKWKDYKRRTGGDYATWRKQLAEELDAEMTAIRTAMTPEERAAASARGLQAVREIMDE